MRMTASFLVLVLACAALAAAACGGAAASPPPAGTDGGDLAAAADSGTPVQVTYRDVAPLIAQRCLACHEHGGVAPFPLTTFGEVAPLGAAIASAVQARTMPPWLPSDGCQTFRDARHLEDAEIALFTAWVAQGTPEGAPLDAAALASPPQRTLAWTDETVDLGADYTPQSVQGPGDDWRCFVIDPQVTEDVMVVGYDFEPTVRGQVHHAGFLEGPIDAARARDDADPGPGWSCPGGVDVPTGNLIGSWAAGYGAVEYPAGTGMPLAKGQGLIVQIHYHQHDLTKPPTPDRTRISLQLARGPTTAATFLALGVADINLPPHSKGTTLEASLTLATDTVIRGEVGHMHLLGRSLHVEATPPAGASSCLFDLPRWDYRWEELLFLDPPPRFPAGTTLKLTCTWDNPGDATVVYGLTAADEMCDLGLIATTP